MSCGIWRSQWKPSLINNSSFRDCWNQRPFSEQFVTPAEYSCWCQIHIWLDLVQSRNIFLLPISLHTWTRPTYSPSEREGIIKWKHIALIRASYKERENCQRNIFMRSCRVRERLITFPLPLFPNIYFYMRIFLNMYYFLLHGFSLLVSTLSTIFCRALSEESKDHNNNYTKVTWTKMIQLHPISIQCIHEGNLGC